MHVHGFAPLADASSRVLILGTMPSKASLRAHQYYAHPRNLFWPLMAEILAVDATAPYEQRVEQLLASGVALWDVLEACTRGSSLDSDIVASSALPNAFDAFLELHPSLRAICFNGAKAEALFHKHVRSTLALSSGIARVRLPSTSPANAAIPRAKKVETWRIIATFIQVGERGGSGALVRPFQTE